MKTALVVPCYIKVQKDLFHISRLLEHANQQIQTIDEIIIVDDHSPVNLANHKQKCKIIRMQTNSGPATARNIGIETALELGADIIFFTDSDCVPTPNWTSSMTFYMESNEIMACGGITKSLGNTIVDQFHNINGTLNGRCLSGTSDRLLYACTCNFAITRPVAKKYRFNEKYPTAAGEDVDFCLRIRHEFEIGLSRCSIILHDFQYAGGLGIMKDIRKLKTTFIKYKSANELILADHPEFFSTCWHRSIAIPSEPVE